MVGGITAALIDFSGIPEDEARGYEQQLHAGKTLVAVKARDEDSAEVRRILDEIGASTVRDDQTDLSATVRRPVRVAMYDDQGQRVGEQRELGATHPRGIYDTPAADDQPNRQSMDERRGRRRRPGPAGRARTPATYDSRQWVGEGQGEPQPDDHSPRNAHIHHLIS